MHSTNCECTSKVVSVMLFYGFRENDENIEKNPWNEADFGVILKKTYQ